MGVLPARKIPQGLMAYKIGWNTSMKALYESFERWEKKCHPLHLSLLLSARDVLYEPLENFRCIFSLKKSDRPKA